MASSSANFTDKGKKEWDELVSSFQNMDGSAVTVGIHANDAGRDDGEMNNAALAAIHEFGKTFQHPGGTPYKIVGDGKAVFVEKGEEHDGVTGPHMITIPQRSFLRSTASEKREMWLSTFIKAVANELPQNSVSDAAERVGAMMMGHVKRKITDLKSPPNTPGTIRQKSVNGNVSDNPLIDTGQLRRAIDYEVNI